MENTNRPKVSVCIPTYNHARFLHDAIDSVLAQTFSDFELVIVDNCSTDNTTQLVEAYTARDRRIRYVRNQINVGAQNNLNRCLELASGEYVKILCADDLLEPTCLKKMVKVLDEFPDVSLVSSARTLTNEDLRPLLVLSYSCRPKLVSGVRAMKKCLRNNNLIGEPSAVLFRKKDAARGFNTSYRQLIDLDMWFHLLQKGDFAFIPEPLCRFRKHAGQETKGNIKSFSFVEDSLVFLEESVTDSIGNSALYRHLWRVQVGFDVWSLLFSGASLNVVHRKIREVYPLGLFYTFLPCKIFVQLMRTIRGRITAL